MATSSMGTLPSTSSTSSKKFSDHHLAILKECYGENPNPTAKSLRSIAARAGLTHLQCKAWFQYQRKKRKKNVLENQSESLYKEIKLLVEDLGRAKERNAALLTENKALRRNVEDFCNVADGEGAAEEEEPTLGTAAKRPRTMAADASPGSEQTQDPLAAIKAALLRPPAGASSTVSKPLDVNNVDVSGQIASNAGDHVKRASRVVTRVLQGEGKNTQVQDAVLHSQEAQQVRAVMFQSENPMDIITVLMKSLDDIVGDKGKTAQQKEQEVGPLLDSFVKAELAIKDAQLSTRKKLAGQLPLLPRKRDPAAVLQPDLHVRSESVMCIFNMSYLGYAERSLCLMGEASLYALFVQAYDLINLEEPIPFDQIMLMHKFREDLKKQETELVCKFEVGFHLPYAFVERHRDASVRSHVESVLATSAEDTSALMIETMEGAVKVYKEGIAKCYEKLPPLLCARIFLAMHKVKQILRASDGFYQLLVK